MCVKNPLISHLHPQIRTFQVRLAVSAIRCSVEPITTCFAVEIFKKNLPSSTLIYFNQSKWTNTDK